MYLIDCPRVQSIMFCYLFVLAYFYLQIMSDKLPKERRVQRGSVLYCLSKVLFLLQPDVALQCFVCFLLQWYNSLKSDKLIYRENSPCLYEYVTLAFNSISMLHFKQPHNLQ